MNPRLVPVDSSTPMEKAPRAVMPDSPNPGFTWMCLDVAVLKTECLQGSFHPSKSLLARSSQAIGSGLSLAVLVGVV